MSLKKWKIPEKEEKRFQALFDSDGERKLRKEGRADEPVRRFPVTPCINFEWRRNRYWIVSSFP